VFALFSGILSKGEKLAFKISIHELSFLPGYATFDLIALVVILFSVYLNDLYGQIFALIILTIAASESAIGLAIIITNYRIRGNISLNLLSSLKQ
jgi:NADH-quinone oxidoreductase subunit K